jgi:hypothetical protein
MVRARGARRRQGRVEAEELGDGDANGRKGQRRPQPGQKRALWKRRARVSIRSLPVSVSPTPRVSTYPALNGPAQRCPCSRAPRCRTGPRRRASARRPRARRRRRRVAWRGRVCLGRLARGTWCCMLWCAGRSAGRLGGFRQGGRAWWRGGNRFYGVVFCYAIDATVEAGAELAGEVIRPRGNISRARELGLRSNTPAVACMLGYRMHG